MLSRVAQRNGSTPVREIRVNFWVGLWVMVLLWPALSWLFFSQEAAIKTQKQAASAYSPTSVKHP